jgi:hypothetical protein
MTTSGRLNTNAKGEGMLVLALKVLLVAVIGGLVSMFVFGGSFSYGFIVLGLIAAFYVWRNRKTVA